MTIEKRGNNYRIKHMKYPHGQKEILKEDK